LQLVSIGVLAKRAAKLPVLGRKAFHFTGFVEPGKKKISLNAAVGAVNPEAFRKIAAMRNGQFQMRQRATCQLRFNEPTKGAVLLEQSGADSGHFPGEKPRGVQQMTSMSQHEIAVFV